MAQCDRDFCDALRVLCRRSGLPEHVFMHMEQYRIHPKKVETYEDQMSPYGGQRIVNIEFALTYEYDAFKPESQRKPADFESTGEWIDEDKTLGPSQRLLEAYAQ